MDPAYPIPVAESQGTIIGNDLLLVGGFNNGYGQATNQTWAMDTTSSTVLWRQMDDHPIPTGITHASLAIAGTKFYMCGGYVGGDPGQATSLCYVFDHSKAPTTGQWSTFAPLPDVRAGGGLVYNTQRNALYYSGGAMRPQVGVATAVDYNTTWMYSLNNPSAGWVSKAPIPYTANHMSFVSAKDAAGMERHYFLGGQTSSDECCGNHAENYEWDAVNEIWIKRANMPIARGHAASSTRAIGSGFIIAGGTTNVNGKTTDISYYDIPSDTWTSIGNLTYAINTPVCDMAGGTLFCESGWETGYFSWRRQITF